MELSKLGFMSFKTIKVLAICGFDAQKKFQMFYTDWEGIHETPAWSNSSLPVYRIEVLISGVSKFFITSRSDGDLDNEAFRSVVFENLWREVEKLWKQDKEKFQPHCPMESQVSYSIDEARLVFLPEEGRISFDIYTEEEYATWKK